MHHSLIKLVCLGLVLGGCDSGSPAADAKNAATKPADTKPADTKPADTKPAETKPAVATPDAPEAAPVKAPPPFTPEMMAERGKQLEEDRTIAEAYSAGKLGDRLAADKMLLVDAKVPADTDEARYFLFTGKVPAPADFAALTALKASAGDKLIEVLYGGEDTARAALFRDIEPGAYTVCVVLSGPIDPAKRDYLKKSEEAYKAADKDGKLSAEKLHAAAAKAQAETGYVRKEIDWNSQPVRCNVAEVTADAKTRVVVVAWTTKVLAPPSAR